MISVPINEAISMCDNARTYGDVIHNPVVAAVFDHYVETYYLGLDSEPLTPDSFMDWWEDDPEHPSSNLSREFKEAFVREALSQ